MVPGQVERARKFCANSSCWYTSLQNGSPAWPIRSGETRPWCRGSESCRLACTAVLPRHRRQRVGRVAGLGMPQPSKLLPKSDVCAHCDVGQVSPPAPPDPSAAPGGGSGVAAARAALSAAAIIAAFVASAGSAAKRDDRQARDAETETKKILVHRRWPALLPGSAYLETNFDNVVNEFAVCLMTGCRMRRKQQKREDSSGAHRVLGGGIAGQADMAPTTARTPPRRREPLRLRRRCRRA